jgi:hypothetical protein
MMMVITTTTTMMTILTRIVYEGRLKSSWTGGNAPLLCRCQVVVVGVEFELQSF